MMMQTMAGVGKGWGELCKSEGSSSSSGNNSNNNNDDNNDEDDDNNDSRGGSSDEDKGRGKDNNRVGVVMAARMKAVLRTRVGMTTVVRMKVVGQWDTTSYNIFQCPLTPSGIGRHHFLGLMCTHICCSFVL